jgi:hypothetical protein
MTTSTPVHARRSPVVLALALLAAACSSGAAAPASAPSPTPAGEVPRQIGQFALVQRAPLSAPAVGTIYRFRDSTAINLSVITYDLSSDDATRNATAPARVKAESELFLQILAIQMRRGVYDTYHVLLVRPDSVVVGRVVTPGMIATASVEERGRAGYELQYLYLINRTFVKIRVSVPGTLWPRPDLDGFATELVTALTR